jgi:uncharacterized protein
MASFDALLAVQGHDTALAQLHHRRSHLPEHQEVLDVTSAIAALARRREPLVVEEAGLSTKQAAFESQLHDVDTKIVSADRSLFGGTVTATRELQALEADLASLRRRRSELEDQELEVLMAREPVDAALAALADEQGALDTRLADAQRAEVAAAAFIEAQAVAERTARVETAATVDPALLARYESIRGKNGGLGVARIDGGSCGACRLKISAVEMDRIRGLAADVIVTCEECGALLVR